PDGCADVRSEVNGFLDPTRTRATPAPPGVTEAETVAAGVWLRHVARFEERPSDAVPGCGDVGEIVVLLDVEPGVEGEGCTRYVCQVEAVGHRRNGGISPGGIPYVVALDRDSPNDGYRALPGEGQGRSSRNGQLVVIGSELSDACGQRLAARQILKLRGRRPRGAVRADGGPDRPARHVGDDPIAEEIGKRAAGLAEVAIEARLTADFLRQQGIERLLAKPIEKVAQE